MAVNELIDRRTRLWAVAAFLLGVVLFIVIELVQTPGMTPGELALELLGTVPIILTSVGLAILLRVARRRRDEPQTLIQDLESARAQGQRWRAESRALLSGLGEAIDAQFSRWNLTQTEREVALMLLKGLSLKDIAALRVTTERAVRAQTHSLYGKAGVTSRAALAAFFLEDLLAPSQPR